MTETEIVAYLEAAARAAGVQIAPEQRDGTIANFARIAAMAELVNAIELDATVEPAPVFRHD